MRLNEVNSLTHLLNTDDSDELNIIRHSPYFSDDDLLQSSTCHKNGLSILSLNCQSLHAKFDYIKLLIDKFVANNSPLQVLCLQESWFSSDTDLSPYMISGYHLISTGHYASNHGGLVIYLNDSWSYKLKSCQTDSQIWEKQIIEICNPNDLRKKAIIIGNVYRPPYNSRDSYTTFSLEFNAMLLEYQSTSQKTYMCGDYNIDLLKVNDLKFNEEYFHDILSAGYIPTITLPTRLSVSSSLIDNIFTTNLSNDISACILNVHISDHQPVIIFCNDEVPLSRTKYITITINSDKAKTNFCQSFQNKQVFKRLDNNNDDPNHNYQILEESLINSHNECFPTRVVKFNRKRHKISPWMTNGILKSINHRNRLYKNLKQYKPDSFMYTEKQLQFNRYRNELKKTITHAKRSHYQDLFKQFKFDMKKTWAVLS